MAIGTPTSIGSATDTGTATLQLTTTGTAVVGDTILIFAGSRGNQVSSVADSAGNTYAIDVQAVNGIATAAVIRARVTSQLTAGGTITITYDTSALYYMMGAVVVSGLDATPLDQTQNTGAFGATSWTSGSTATTTVADELIFGGGAAGFVATTSTPGASQTELFDLQSTSNTYACNYRIVSSTGAYEISGTWGAGPSEQVAVVATYKAAAGGTNATVDMTGVLAAATAASVAPPKPRPVAPFSEINVRM